MGIYFPLFVDLTDKKICVIGAGRVALRRLETLQSFAKNITVIAPEALDAVQHMAQEGRIRLILRAYQYGDIPGDAALVLAATNDLLINQEIYAECREKNIPVNVCSQKELCDFYFPGIAASENLVAGVTSCGTDHHAAKKATEEIQKLLEQLKE